MEKMKKVIKIGGIIVGLLLAGLGFFGLACAIIGIIVYGISISILGSATIFLLFALGGSYLIWYCYKKK